MDCQHHVRRMVAYGCIRVGGSVVEEVEGCLLGALCWASLLLGQAAEGMAHGWIDGTGIEKERARDLLDEGRTIVVQGGQCWWWLRTVVSCCRKLVRCNWTVHVGAGWATGAGT